jgi:hypothetical protein
VLTALSLFRVRGTRLDFSDTPQHWRPPCFSRRTAHDATTEEVQEERSS